ncbi:hypothetical protein [Sporomusa acidovorans]|uniref:hypothetical protein n=1 Tax=Sporomusa acidovorans TaxID=112900 RepID=UPI001C408EC3|nr:hypothetical protein [Sporomusa acidovorans]
MGAVGAALLVQEKMRDVKQTAFRGFEVADFEYQPRSFECTGCANLCEIVDEQRSHC